MIKYDLSPKKILASLLLAIVFLLQVKAQPTRTETAGIPINYDQSKVPTYTLPDPLILENGEKVTNSKTWINERRPEIFKLFASEQFGKAPDRKDVSFEVFEKGTPAFDSKVIRRQVTIYFTSDTSDYKTDLLIYLPTKSKGPVPLFFRISFSPNSLSFDDPGIREGMIWTREGERIHASEGRSFGKFDLDKFIDEGIGVASIYYGDIEPDFPDGLKYGIIGHFFNEGENYPAPDEWGAISAWAWGLSRAMDYLQTDKDIDPKKIALHGVSRLGKTVLWTGASDERFGMILASCSGEGGAAISRRQYGETIAHMIHPTRYYYQFSLNRMKYAWDPNTCPVDAHMLVSLIAPRPLLLQTGDTDYWSDPKGEFDAAVAAEPVYELFGKKGLQTKQWPAAGKPILNDLGYYMHSGGHGTVPEDYDVYIDFMKKHFMK
ncbi:MAG: acetylxylan esterase [Bacteroidota bacterium]